MIGLAIQVARWTPLVTWPTGTASQGRPGQRSRQRLRDTCPWRRETPFTRADIRMAQTVMWNWPSIDGMLAELEERVPLDAHLLPDRPGARLERFDGEGVVPRGHRRVGGEHAVGAHLAHRLVERRAGHHQLAQPLDHHERGVALVGVPDGGIDAERAQHPHAADAEDPLLPHPEVGAAGVQLVHQAAVVGVVRARGWCRAGRSAPGRPSSARRGRAPAGPRSRTVVR